jgi:hypothetical protein
LPLEIEKSQNTDSDIFSCFTARYHGKAYAAYRMVIKTVRLCEHVPTISATLGIVTGIQEGLVWSQALIHHLSLRATGSCIE